MLTESEIRQRIAESGKMTIRDIVAYFKNRWEGQYDLKVLKSNAKELIKEAKQYM